MKKSTVIGLLLLAFCAACRFFTPVADFYANTLYPAISGGLSAVSSVIPFSLADIVKPEMRDSLAALMVQRLVNGRGEYYFRQYEHTPDEYTDILDSANGCALIEEGLIIYFYPYNLGCGADGEYEAVIPYEELDEILSPPLSLLLVP